MKAQWKPGHSLCLLENGEEFYPRVFETIRNAKQEVLIETFILFEDKVGIELQQTLIEAASRGVRVELTVDGFGSPDLSDDFVRAMTAAGVGLHIFDPQPRFLGFRLNVFRRLHRKLVVVDRERAFVGGINFSIDHLGEYGPEAKQDYAVELTGPVVDDIWLFMESVLAKGARRPFRMPSLKYATKPEPKHKHVDAQSGSVMFVTRDNDRHQTDIERHYREAIRSARSEVVIANAYFFPGFRLLMELRRAARRGVKVKLILQGQPDVPMAKWSARRLYSYLLKAGVEIHEYCQRPLHGKVAVVDEVWSTVGSSNLDPLSLALNLEANVLILDRAFNRHLRERLGVLMENHCRQFSADQIPPRSVWQTAINFLVFHFARRFPSWVGLVPRYRPHLKTVRHEPSEAKNLNDQESVST